MTESRNVCNIRSGTPLDIGVRFNLSVGGEALDGVVDALRSSSQTSAREQRHPTVVIGEVDTERPDSVEVAIEVERNVAGLGEFPLE